MLCLCCGCITDRGGGSGGFVECQTAEEGCGALSVTDVIKYGKPKYNEIQNIKYGKPKYKRQNMANRNKQNTKYKIWQTIYVVNIQT